MASQYLEIARVVLQQSDKALSARSIVDEAKRQGLFPDSFSGRTPHQTMKSKLSVEIRRNGKASEFIRRAPGLFTLRPNLPESEVFQAKPTVKISKEDVLVCLADSIPSPRFQGITTNWRKPLEHLLRDSNLSYMPRLEAEQTVEFKQFITYVMLTYKGKLLAYDRGTYSSADSFLHGRSCVGFGGHTTVADRNLFDSRYHGIYACAIRELSEELRLPSQDRERLNSGKHLKIIGLLNDDSSDNGKRHLAVIMQYEVSSEKSWKDPIRGEKAITALRWLSPTSLIDINGFEYWSQLCIRIFHPALYSSQNLSRIIKKSSFKRPHILIISGKIAAGKTTATVHLIEKYGYSGLNAGEVLAELLGETDIEQNRLEFQKRASEFINREDGPELLARAIMSKVNESESRVSIIVDGVRQAATVAALRKCLGRQKLAILQIEKPVDLAYKHYISRLGAVKTFEEFMSIRDAPVEQEVPHIGRLADAVVYNRGTKHEFLGSLDRLMYQLEIKPCA